MAQDVHYGDQTCQPGSNATTAQCEVWESETACQASGRCEWKYNGQVKLGLCLSVQAVCFISKWQLLELIAVQNMRSRYISML